MITDTLNWLYTANPGWKTRALQDIKLTDIKLFEALLKEEKEEAIAGVVKNDRNEVLDGVVDMMWICLNLAAMCGIQPEELENYAKEVSQSNWSKFDVVVEDVNKSIELYASGKHPDKMGQKIDVGCTHNGNPPFIIKRTEDGKIMKSYKYNKLT